MHQCSFVIWNKHTTLMAGVDRKTVCMWGQGVCGNFLYFLLNLFCV